jgi:adenylate cyclase
VPRAVVAVPSHSATVRATVIATGVTPGLAGRAAGGRRLIAVAYADVAGYSRLIGLDDAGTLRRLHTLRRAVIDPAVHEFGGHVVQTGGDLLLIAFDSIDGAVRCAVKVQEQVPVYDGDQLPDRRIRFRVGINIGDVISEGTNLHGEGVNVAARLEAVSPVGGLCVSRTVVEHVQSRLNLPFETLGSLRLKNIAQPVEAFVLRMDPACQTSGPTRPVPTQAVAPSGVGLSTAPRLSLVVLPFDNLGGVDDSTVDAITEELTTELSRITDCLVIDCNTAFTYRGRPIEIKRLGTEIGVRYAVEGRVRVVSGALRVNVQLVSTETGMHLWADRFEAGRDAGDRALDDVVQQMRIALNTRLLDIESARSALERPVNPDAIDLLLQARTLNSLPPNPQLLAQRITLYERAVELDPRSVRALVGLAEALIDSVSVGSEDPSAPMKFRWADELTRRAELLRPDDAYVMYVRLYLLGKEWRWSEAIPAAQRAIEAHPNMPGAHLWLGMCLMHDGRAADAIAEFRQSLRLRPRSPYNYNRYRTIGEALIFAGEYEEAISWLQRSLAVNPNQSREARGTTYVAIAAAKAIIGQAEEARLSATEALRFWPTLTARGYYQLNVTNPTHAAEVSRLRDGLRLAGVRDHADEDANSGLAADDALHTDYAGPTQPPCLVHEPFVHPT